MKKCHPDLYRSADFVIEAVLLVIRLVGLKGSVVSWLKPDQCFFYSDEQVIVIHY